MNKYSKPTPRATTILRPVKQKLQRMGYTVTPVKSDDLPKSFTWEDKYLETWYKLSVQGMPVTNNTCEHNLWTSSELSLFSARLPEVQQEYFA